MAVIGRFLARLGTKVWSIVGPTLIHVLIERIRAWVAAYRARAEIKAAAKAEREATEKATTPEEREHAADNNRRL